MPSTTTMPTKPHEKTYLAVLPKNVMLSPGTSNESDETTLYDVPFLRLPHPRTSKPNLYLPTPAGSTTSGESVELRILEVQVINPSPARSWFLTDPAKATTPSKLGADLGVQVGSTEERIIADGSMLLFTPIDPLFLLIPFLIGLLRPSARTSKIRHPTSGGQDSDFVAALSDVSRRGNFLPLDDLVEELSRLPHCTNMDEPFKPRSKSSIKSTRRDPIASIGSNDSSASSRRNASNKRTAEQAGLSQNGMTAEEVDEEEAQRLEMEMRTVDANDETSPVGREKSVAGEAEDQNVPQSHMQDDVDMDGDDVEHRRRSGSVGKEDSDESKGNTDVVRLCSIGDVGRVLVACCETQQIPSFTQSTSTKPASSPPPQDTQTFYRPSPKLILSHLQRKVARLATRELIDRSDGLMRGLAMSGIGEEVMRAGERAEGELMGGTGGKAEMSMATTSDSQEGSKISTPLATTENLTEQEIRTARLKAVANQARRKIACEVIGQYLPAEVLSALMGSYDFSDLNEHLEAQANVSFAGTHNTAMSSNPADANVLIGDSGIKKKPAVVQAQGSRGVKALGKVNTSKMPKLTSFFTKKGPAAEAASSKK